MNYWRACLLITCVLLSGCAVGTGHRANTSPAPAPAGSSKTYTYSTPRNRVPIAHQPEVRQTPVTHSEHVALLSPRMQGVSGANPTFESFGASVSKVGVKLPGPPEGNGSNDQKPIAQPTDLKAFGQISNQEVAAASLLPPVGPHYAIVIILVALACGALCIIAGLVRRAAGAIPLEGTDESSGEFQAPDRDSNAGSGQGQGRPSGGINMKSVGANEPPDSELDRSEKRKKALRDIQSRIKRTFKAN